MKTFTAHFDGKALVPDEPVDLPAGSKYRVSLEPAEQEEQVDGSLREFLLKFAGTIEGCPPDLAKNHDHYLYGKPRR